jgi:hypothetical protein
LAPSVPLSRSTPQVGGGSAFYVRRLRTTDFMTRYFPTLRGWIAFLLAAFAILFFPVLRPALLVQSGVGTFLSEPATPAVRVTGAVLVIVCFLASVEAFRRGSRVDKIVACIAVLLTIGLIVEVLQLFVLSVHQSPNKSPEPTAVGAVRSAIAVHVASRRWLSFLR